MCRDDKRIVIHFTPYHGSWLNLVEVWFSILAGKVLGESFGSPDAIKVAIEAFTETWNTLLAHPFRWTYDGQGLHEKAVRRFTRMLNIATDNLDIRILTKQMRLLTNLLDDYFDEVSMNSWMQFADALAAHAKTLDTLIDNEPGPQRKKKALQTAADLRAALQQHSALIEYPFAV